MKILLLAVTVDDDDVLDVDLIDGLKARLDEFYPYPEPHATDPLVPSKVLAVALTPRAAQWTAMALDVGIEGMPADVYQEGADVREMLERVIR